MAKKRKSTPVKSSILRHEDITKKHTVQQKRFYNYLKRNTVSCSMACDALKIPQKCLTFYKRNLEKAGHLKEIKKSKCEITGRYVWFLSTNPKVMPVNRQTKLL